MSTRYSPAVEVVVEDGRANPKWMQREARKPENSGCLISDSRNRRRSIGAVSMGISQEWLVLFAAIYKQTVFSMPL